MATQWMKEKMRDAKAKIHSYPEVKQRAKNASNSDPWGPSMAQKQEVAADAATDDESLALVLRALWKRVNEEDGAYWMHIVKALELFEYMLIMGVRGVKVSILKHRPLLHQLLCYNLSTESEAEKRFDTNQKVISKAQRMLTLLDDNALVQQEQEKILRTAQRAGQRPPTIYGGAMFVSDDDDAAVFRSELQASRDHTSGLGGQGGGMASVPRGIKREILSVEICPLCSKFVLMYEGTTPDLAMSEHIDTGCKDPDLSGLPSNHPVRVMINEATVTAHRGTPPPQQQKSVAMPAPTAVTAATQPPPAATKNHVGGFNTAVNANSSGNMTNLFDVEPISTISPPQTNKHVSSNGGASSVPDLFGGNPTTSNPQNNSNSMLDIFGSAPSSSNTTVANHQQSSQQPSQGGAANLMDDLFAAGPASSNNSSISQNQNNMQKQGDQIDFFSANTNMNQKSSVTNSTKTAASYTTNGTENSGNDAMDKMLMNLNNFQLKN